MSIAENGITWLDATEAAALLGCDPKRVPAAMDMVSAICWTNARPRRWREDQVLALREAIRPLVLHNSESFFELAAQSEERA